MAKELLFILRQSPDWHALSEDYRRGRAIDPDRFRPPVHIPGFPANIVELVEQWNATMRVDFFTCRSRLKELCEDSLAQIPNARRFSYLEVDKIGPELSDSIVFYHDDDDWFSPIIGETLEEVLPPEFDVCVFPLVRISADTTTLARQVGKPKIVIGRQRPFSHRYQSNNYGINGKTCDREMLLAMKDHVEASEYANGRGLRDVYIDRFISATAKTPCSAQAVAMLFHPDSAEPKSILRDYTASLRQLVFPEELSWISSRVAKVAELFEEAAGPENEALPVVNPATVSGGEAASHAVIDSLRPHAGIGAQKFFAFLAERIDPSTYLEIGTRSGDSLSNTNCDCICVDPEFKIETDVIKNRRRAFFFQMTSDAFFASNDIKQYFPSGIDLAFLDGMRRFEFLLRDFINTEKYCRPDSVIVIRDCLPRNPELIGRSRRPGAWNGDVWKILPILKRYRPALNILAFDAPPAGLVACTELDPFSTVLSDSYDRIVTEFLTANVPPDIDSLFPLRKTRFLQSHPGRLRKLLFFPNRGSAEPAGMELAGLDAPS